MAKKPTHPISYLDDEWTPPPEWTPTPDGPRPGHKPNGHAQPNGQHPLQPFPATTLFEHELANIPPREIVYGHFLFRKFISVLGAPGGSGKTAYAFVVALALAAGRDLLSEGVYDPGAVWLYNLEDPRTELLRRVKAAMISHEITFQDIEDRLYLDSGRDRPLIIATAMPDGTVVAWPQVQALIDEIKARDVRLLIVDPFVRSHKVIENHNDQIDVVMALWAKIADEANCSILLVHHFRKGGTAGEASAFRGASAQIDASRAAVTLAGMTTDEANKLGVEDEDRWQYVRVDNAKLNLAPPPTQATWLKLTGVSLENATDNRAADNVQTVTRWEPTSPWAEFPMSLVERILDKLSRGPEEGEQYHITGGTGDRWAGKVIVEEACKQEAQAKAILAAWKRADLIKAQEYHSPKDRKLRQGMAVNQALLSEMRQAANAKTDD